MRRLFMGTNAIDGDRIRITDKDDIVYLATVLRLKTGDRLLVSDGINNTYETEILDDSKSGVTLGIITQKTFQADVKTRITLYQGIPKGAKMDEVVRKSTELGVWRIVPVYTARSVPEYREGVPAGKLARWRKIAEEAARQSHRLQAPAVSDIQNFSAAADDIPAESYDAVLLLYELEEAYTLKNALRERLRADREEGRALRIAVFIGPEGGFERGEAELLVRGGASAVTVGDTILRTETAGPAAIAMILYELEL